MKKLNSKKNANSRRGTANSRYLRARSRAHKPPGFYRPSRPPRPARDTTQRNFWIFTAVILLAFSLGQIWKVHEVARVCARLDSLRSHQRDLEEKCLALRLKFDEIASYPKIESLARTKLGMLPSSNPPVVIAPLNDRFFTYRRNILHRVSWRKN